MQAPSSRSLLRLYDSYMSYGLNSLKGDYIGDDIGNYYRGVIKGDTRSLDYSSYNPGITLQPQRAISTSIVD